MQLHRKFIACEHTKLNGVPSIEEESKQQPQYDDLDYYIMKVQHFFN